MSMDVKNDPPVSGLSTIFQSFARKAGTLVAGWDGTRISTSGMAATALSSCSATEVGEGSKMGMVK